MLGTIIETKDTAINKLKICDLTELKIYLNGNNQKLKCFLQKSNKNKQTNKTQNCLVCKKVLTTMEKQTGKYGKAGMVR